MTARQEDFTQLARNFRATMIISMLRVVFNGCAEVPSTFYCAKFSCWVKSKRGKNKNLAKKRRPESRILNHLELSRISNHIGNYSKSEIIGVARKLR